MYCYFSDLHVDLIARAVLDSGEQLVAKTVTTYRPWWALGFINKTFLVFATDRRLVLVEHRMSYLHQANKMHSVESLPWAAVQEARITGLFTKKLRVRGQSQSGITNLKMGIPNALFGLLAPMRNNMAGARALDGAFKSTRALMAPGPQSVPMPPTYPSAQPPQFAPQAYAPALPAPPQVPQFDAPYSAPLSAAPIPPQNAPGYASVPPPSVQPPPLPSARPPLPPRRSYPQA
jgi:hypothetical protein